MTSQCMSTTGQDRIGMTGTQSWAVQSDQAGQGRAVRSGLTRMLGMQGRHGRAGQQARQADRALSSGMACMLSGAWQAGQVM